MFFLLGADFAFLINLIVLFWSGFAVSTAAPAKLPNPEWDNDSTKGSVRNG